MLKGLYCFDIWYLGSSAADNAAEISEQLEKIYTDFAPSRLCNILRSCVLCDIEITPIFTTASIGLLRDKIVYELEPPVHSALPGATNSCPEQSGQFIAVTQIL